MYSLQWQRTDTGLRSSQVAPARVLTCASLHTKEAPGPEKQQHECHTGEFGTGVLGTMSGAQRSYRPSVIGKSRENEGGRQSELLSREKAFGKECGEEESGTWEVAKKGRFGDNGYPVSMESLRRPGFSKPVLRQDKQQLKASPSCPLLPLLGRLTDNGALIISASSCWERHGSSHGTNAFWVGQTFPSTHRRCPLSQLRPIPAAAEAQRKGKPPVASHQLSVPRYLPLKYHSHTLRFAFLMFFAGGCQ